MSSTPAQRLSGRVWLSSIAPRWYEKSISLSAVKDIKSGRWRLGKMQVGTGHDRIDCSTRSKMRIAAEVYR